MSRFWGPLRKRMLGIRQRDISWERRGFRRAPTAQAQARLEEIVHSFVGGYHAALEEDRPNFLTPILASFVPDLQGFVFEGAAMALALLDYLTPWRRHRVRSFLSGAGNLHRYMVHVGVGWAVARLPGAVEGHLARLDPLLRWLAVDGYGFHEGFFRGPGYLGGIPAPSRLGGYARRAFDQGLGRCLWFIEGGDIELIPETIRRFAPDRHRDLWSGLGLACAYVGVAEGIAALEAVAQSSGRYRSHLAQGAAFAAKARLRAGNLGRHTETVCRVFCGTSAQQAAAITDAALEGLPTGRAEPAYETWRQRVQERFT